MCGCATSNSQVHRVLRIDRPCGRITCRRTQSIQNIRMHIACFEFTAPLDEFHAAVCSYMPRTHGQKQDEFSCTSHALNSPSVWTNHMRSHATNSTKTCIRIVCFEFTASRDELHAGVCSCMSHMLGQQKRIRVQFACLKFAVRLDELYADVYSCMLGMRNKKRIIMRGARTMTMTLMMAMEVMMEMTMAMA